MGFPIARVTDQYSAHSDICVVGSPNVKANNLQVHRVLDMFVCPIVGIGLTMTGSPTVRANNMPVAKVTSQGQCQVPNTLIRGSPNVNVG